MLINWYPSQPPEQKVKRTAQALKPPFGARFGEIEGKINNRLIAFASTSHPEMARKLEENAEENTANLPSTGTLTVLWVVHNDERKLDVGQPLLHNRHHVHHVQAHVELHVVAPTQRSYRVWTPSAHTAPHQPRAKHWKYRN